MFTLIIITAFAILISLIIFYRKSTNKTIDTDQKERYSSLLQQNVLFYRKLDESKKIRFVEKVCSFLGRTTIEGIGTAIDDKDRVLVAASAIIPIFNFGNWEYRNLTNVILYRDTFNHEFEYEGENRSLLGMVGTGYLNGQMVLSKIALHKGFDLSGGVQNTAIHEFVHLLDKADGYIDGIPELLLQNSYILPWITAMEQEIRRIQSGKSDIDPYALTHESEFFAVVAEYFFEKPEQFEEKHPELFSIVNQMFNPESKV
ncbi:M90 family metallopeptidase [Pedobacter sp. P351]|uniref:M90 family metallopeptidase n=1 Tax=Pedobacter superstes TaxID=3133441 RepID=UPI00309B57D3